MTGKQAFVSVTPSLFAIAHAAQEESTANRSQCIVALVFSAAALEAYVNEVCEYAGWIDSQEIPQSVRTLGVVAEELEGRNAQLHLKLQLISVVLTGQLFDKSTVEYHDFDLLVRIRHALLHLRPHLFDFPVADRDVHPIVRRLVSRGIITEPGEFIRQDWFSVLHDPAIAAWGFRTAHSVAVSIATMFPEGDFRDSMVVNADMMGGPDRVAKYAHLLKFVPPPE